MGESMTVEGATDAEAFEAYVEHFLAPSLEEGQVVVLDGLGAHRTEKVRELWCKQEERTSCSCRPTRRT
jgi:transposase